MVLAKSRLIILGQRTLADAVQHGEITTIGDAKRVSDLSALSCGRLMSPA
jgi:hypothetical protein